MPIRLIVGLGNPGPQYEASRHNAGAMFVEAVARKYNAELRAEKRFHGLLARTTIASQDVRLLIPTTFMNRSGQAVAALATFYKIKPTEILLAHDELDMEPGIARLKQGGGHGGHNGLRDTISALASNAGFARLRLGIGHPGSSDQVTAYVLSKPPSAERAALDAAIQASLEALPMVTTGDLAGAMNQLHRIKASKG
jgi:PTH1 family peptidyl-tRNA hydrolase